MEKFIIVKDIKTNVKRFNLKGHKLEFNIKPTPSNVDPLSWFKEAVEDILIHATKDLLPSDKVGITFCGETFKEHGPGWMNFRDASSLHMNDVWELIAKIFQSNAQGMSTDTFCLGVTSVRLPQGSGPSRKTKYNTFNEECVAKRGIVTISNNDNLCLPRALIVAIAYTEKDPEYKKIRKDTGKLQTHRTKELLLKSKITIPDDGSSILELQKFQQYLSNFNIVVYKYAEKGRDVIFDGRNENSKQNLNLLYENHHFNVITSLTAAFCCGYFCEQCHHPYNNKNAHHCSATCPCCQQSPVCEKEASEIFCKSCNRSFRSEQCYMKHQDLGRLDKKSICVKINRCLKCLKTYNTNNMHVCGEFFCKICKKYMEHGHLCYIQPDTRKPIIKDVLFVFYDLETRQDNIISEKYDTKLHEPNLCVFASRCSACIYDQNLYFCQTCGYRLIVYKENVISNFIKYLLTARKQFKKIVVVAHNGQSFDHQFLLNHILYQTKLKPELIMRGTKILMMQIKNIKFIDSLNYFPMALSKLPKAFDLGPVFKKGYFPHLFNTIANSNYVGFLPPVEYYSSNTMKCEDRKIFLEWYENHKNDIFNMQHDLVDYCKTDVLILTEACIKFRKLMLEECNVCPFTEAVTIASACNLVFRRNFLKPLTIGIIPRNGYRNADNQSKIAIQWLLWEEQNRNINILNSAKQREIVLNGLKVDGYCTETKQIFEFHGCYYHGHPQCLTQSRDTPLYDDKSDTLNQRYENTLSKTKRLNDLGYEVIEMWECEFKKMMLKNKEMDFLKTHPLLSNAPLNPRDAFYGGRTGNTKTYYKCKSNEKIKYIDVCSLYPWVCKYGKFPIGHPILYVGNEACSKLNLEICEGLIKCKILPPQNLYHPVLPIKQNNKLIFSLCGSCSNNKNKNPCNHAEHLRALSGTWTVDEIRQALRKGYVLIEIYEFWSYEVEQYNKLTFEGGLFTKMMNKFIKMKQQASGWPLKCTSQELKEKYIAEFLNNEGVKMEFAEIVNNSGLRSLAKLILNSFWGKFGQRENQPKTDIINKSEELYTLLSNPSIDVCYLMPINEETLVVNYEYKQEAADFLPTVNVCIAAYTTTQARLKLYSFLEKLEDRVLYYDTDSIIYISRDGEYEPETGSFVGDMTDELEDFGSGSYITEFVSGGPKNYAYQIYCSKNSELKTVCKVKGICLNYETSKLINFEVIKNMILNNNIDDLNNIKIISKNIRRTEDHEVVTKTEIKTYKPNAEKRVFLENHDSVPYGYKKLKL